MCKIYIMNISPKMDFPPDNKKKEDISQVDYTKVIEELSDSLDEKSPYQFDILEEHFESLVKFLQIRESGFDESEQKKYIFLKEKLSETISYFFDHELTLYGAKKIIENIDFSNHGDFLKKYELLHFAHSETSNLFSDWRSEVEDIQSLKDMWESIRNNFSEVNEFLNTKSNEKQNNYFLNKYARLIVGKEGNINEGEFNQVTKPTRLTNDIFLLSHFGEIYINKKEDSKNIQSVLDKLNNIPENIKRNTKKLTEYIEDIEYKFESLCSIPVEKEDIVTLAGSFVNKEDFDLYQEFMGGAIRNVVEEDFSIKLTDITIQEQFNFLNYLKHADIEKANRLMNVTKKIGRNAFRSFLSIEHGGQEMGEKTLLLGEKLPEKPAKVLFESYSKIVDASQEVGSLVMENLGKNATPELIEKAQEKLLIRGKNLLNDYSEKAQVCEDTECENLGKELIEELELAKTSAFAFSEVCKLMVEKGEFSFEDFRDIEIAYDRSPLPDKMIQEIKTMHRENTKQYPKGLREYWRKTLSDGLEHENPDQLVVSIKYKGDVISAMRVIQKEDGSWYGASFNVNPTVKGSKIGTELLKKVISDLAKEKPFVADCYAENPMLNTYIDKFGFQITGTDENYHNTGVKVHQITLNLGR